MDWTPIVLLISSLIASAFFSGIEIAFVSSNKLRIELQKQKGTLAGRQLALFIQSPSKFIATTLVGNTISLSIYGISMAGVLEPMLAAHLPTPLNDGLWVLIIETVISTLVVLFTAEFTPKSLFLTNPNRLLTVFALPFKVIYIILWPLVSVVVGISQFIITRVLGLEYSEDKPVFKLTDLDNYIKNIVEAKSEESQEVNVDTKIFANALEFKTVRVRDCMIPRTEITAVSLHDPVDVLKAAFIESGHSKILIYKENIDDVIGYCHSLSLFKKPKIINDILTPIPIVPETMLANELMIQFINKHRSIALVVDEFGGTSGIVTIEDIIEEIFGDIQDEHDVDEYSDYQIDPYTYIVNGRHEIDYLNEKYGWEIPEGDYETLGGYILTVNENIPEVEEVIDAPPLKFTIMTLEDTRIDKVQVNLPDLEEPQENK